MTIFNCKENLSNSSKRCKLLGVALKEAFSNCHTCKRRCLYYPDSDSEEDIPTSDFDHLQELVILIIKARAMQAKVRRNGSIMTHSEAITRTAKQELSRKEDEEMDDFASVKSQFSPSLSAATDSEGCFFSARTEFSCCLSLQDVDLAENAVWGLDGLDNSELKRRAIIQQVCHCEGWPFGLCRKVLLLPPLPKSPSDSWTWCKGTTKVVKTC